VQSVSQPAAAVKSAVATEVQNKFTNLDIAAHCAAMNWHHMLRSPHAGASTATLVCVLVLMLLLLLLLLL
jgi:hypothetical protein